MKKIKVLIVAGAMGVGGIENQLMHLLRQADPNQFQIDFTSTDSKAYYRKEIESLGGGFLEIPVMKPQNPLPYCKALYRIMREGQYDVVHSHQLFHSGIVLAVARRAGIPVRIAHAHNCRDWDGRSEKESLIHKIYKKLMGKSIRRNATFRLACSTLAGEFLYGEKAIVSDNYRLIMNSVDTSRFLDAYDQCETGEFCDDWTNILHVGRFTNIKNQMFLAQIAAEMKKRGKKIRILCAGDGEWDVWQRVNAVIREQKLEDYIKCLGNRSDIDVLVRKASAFVLPSIYEGMPLALIEAQASGLPCVVADTFSHEVDFEIGKIQWKALEDGAASWADALEKAIQEGRAEKTVVETAVKKKGFDSKQFARTLCDLYMNSLAATKGQVNGVRM